MTADVTTTLCTRCGLCCDGSLFADVELAGLWEGAGLEVMGLETEEDDADGCLLLQPCGGLRGRRCGIYAQRPECCRTFECHLLREVRRGALSLAQAGEQIAETLKKVKRVRQISVALGQRDGQLPVKEQGLEALALADETESNAAFDRLRARLEGGMFTLEEMIQTWFLGRS